jgi:hypothetical protein
MVTLLLFAVHVHKYVQDQIRGDNISLDDALTYFASYLLPFAWRPLIAAWLVEEMILPYPRYES